MASFSRCALLLVLLVVAVDGFAMQRTQNESFDFAAHVHDLLWQGLDVDEEDLVKSRVFGKTTRAARAGDAREAMFPFKGKKHKGEENEKQEERGRMSEVVTSPPSRVIIAGPWDSGTNLLEALLTRNLPSAFAGQEDACPHFWKHSISGHRAFLNAVERLHTADGLSVQDTKVIAVLRSPISQASSWYKAPYELRPCVRRPLNTWQEECSAKVSASNFLCGRPPSPPNSTSQVRPLDTITLNGYRDDMSYVHFDGTMEVYNAYVRQYQTLASIGEFSGFKIVTYEEMLYDPRRVVEELAQFLGAQVPQEVDVIHQSAKGHGHAHGRDLALQIYRDRAWLEEAGEEVVQSLCRKLDLTILEDLTEGKSFPGEPGREPLRYAHDCARPGA